MNDTAHMPQHLKISIGGLTGPVYTVKLKDGYLLYTIREEDDVSEQRIAPLPERWLEFKQALDNIGVWQWEKEYTVPASGGTTQWRVEISWDGKDVASSGDDNYPIADGSPENEPELSPTFENFLQAVRKLIGGRAFR